MTRRDDLTELVALHSLDALESDERRTVEQALANDAGLRAELDADRAVAAVLAEAVEQAPPTPSAAVWKGIAAEIHGDTSGETPRLATVHEIKKQRRWTRAAAAISVAAVLVSIGLGFRLIGLQDQVDDATISELAAAKVLEPGAAVVSLEAQEGYEGSSATIVLGADGLGYVLNDSFAPLPDDRTYQLWVIVADGDESKVISAGVLGNDPSVTQFTTAGEVTGFAVTDEVAGGVPVSEGGTVAVGLLGA